MPSKRKSSWSYCFSFFSKCQQFGLKVHAENSHTFLKQANFCGRVIDGEGVRFDPRRLLQSNRAPALFNGVRLFQYEEANQEGDPEKISLTGLWGSIHDSAFQQIKIHLAQSLKLAHPKAVYITCLFSDASESRWSSVLTQLPESQMDLPVEEQGHESPFVFIWRIRRRICELEYHGKRSLFHS